MVTDKSHIGMKIRQLRKARGLTQEQLAEKLDIDNKHLSRIEKGVHLPTYKVIKKLSDVLGFNIYEFESTESDIQNLPDPIFLKSLRILNSAKTEKEKLYYFETLKHAQKGLKLGKSL